MKIITNNDPKKLCEEFYEGITGLKDIDVSNIVHQIINDVLDAVQFAGDSLSKNADEKSLIDNSIGAAVDYIAENYGDL